MFQHQDHKQEQLKKEAKHTFLSQARQSAASSAAQKTIAKALSQASQRVRIILSHSHFSKIKKIEKYLRTVSFNKDNKHNKTQLHYTCKVIG